MAKKESTIANMVLTLFIITAVASVALAFVYNVTKAPIEKAKKEKLEGAIKIVLPEFDKLKEEYTRKPESGNNLLTFYDAYSADDYVGTAVKTYTDKGFSGRIWILVGFLPDGSIQNTAILEHKETPGLGDKLDVNLSDFPLQFIGKNPKSWKLTVKNDGGDVQAITAATISSRAFCDAIDRAYSCFMKNNNGGTE